MKPGFTLIEVLIALVLSTILGSVLYMAFSQSTRTMRTTNSYEIVSISAQRTLDQLNRDLSAVCIPIDPKEKNCFTATNKGAHMDEIQMITTSVLSKDPAKAPARIARVTYHLMHDKNNPTLFTLTRAESSTIQTTEKKPPARNITVLTAISACAVEYMYTVSEKDERIIKKRSDWPSDSKDKLPVTPQAILLALTVTDEQEHVYTYKTHIDLISPCTDLQQTHTVQDKK